MASGSVYKEDVLGYVTSSNDIPWLYDFDADTCCDGDATSESSLATDDGGECKVRAEDSVTFSVTQPVPLDLSLPGLRGSRPNDRIQCSEVFREDGFVKSFVESLSSSVIDDARSDAGERKPFGARSAAVSKLTKIYVRDIAVFGVALLLSQAPFYGIRSFQSSLNGSPGRWALVACHAAAVVATPLVGSAAVTSRIRPKTAVVVSLLVGLPFAVVGAFRVSSETAALLLVAAAAAGAATTWMSAMYDTYVTSLGALCAALADDHRRDGGRRAEAGLFAKVFSQYLLVMQQLSLLVGNFATSSACLMTRDVSAAPFTSLQGR